MSVNSVNQTSKSQPQNNKQNDSSNDTLEKFAKVLSIFIEKAAKKQKTLDCNTDIQHQDYEQNYREASISSRLSLEATQYLDEAVNRTEENKYSIFNEYGLMPEDGMKFMDGEFSQPLCEKSPTFNYTEIEIDGEIYLIETESYISDDKRLKMDVESPNYDGGHGKSVKVSYDSDGINGFDRTATYEWVEGAGYVKVQETFDTDGDGTNEVVLNKEFEPTTKKVPNPDYKWYSGITNFFRNFTGGEKTPKYIDEYDTGYPTNWTTTIGINADDKGSDSKYKDHFEYVETINSSDPRDYHSKQLYINWPSEFENEGHEITEEYGQTSDKNDIKAQYE